MKKFTFRKMKRETGLRAVGNGTPDTIIKRNKMMVGHISGPDWRSKDNKFGIRLMVKASDPPGGFGWVQLKTRFDKEPEARAFLLDWQVQIEAKYDLHEMEDDWGND